MKNFVEEALAQGKRIDGRDFLSFRKIEIVENVSKKAEGSALVKMGETKVIAGVKMDIGEPFKDSPNEGILIVNAEFSPISSPNIEPGPPDENAIELARIVDRVIRESHSIDLEKLFIEEGKVWTVYVDLTVLDMKGNLVDACVLSSLKALWNAKIPKIEDGKIVREEFSGKLPMVYKPVTVSICKYNNNFLIDPTDVEEELINAKLVVGVRDDDKICAIQKQGWGTFHISEIERCLDLAIEKSKELRRLI
ncbi:MAG: exosome complex protein Rrp42 [Candidatus Aenigmarchaeota archaeon]|nr:exosome complex protein Rrp42 [Candidatus Aenigmarchaeota archaeon]MCX8190732.1 exosome complex protein Rrp42 [Candidatus Aenigmarchaeota archaeon]MDW8159980.1 exosome complex protein Rrp42 [Candidatus Aenigmarchaeota archaeon]